MAKKSSMEIAYDLIKNLIAQQKLRPGQQLIEVDISKQAGVSRTPVREAIRALQEEGLVEHRPNKGAYLKYMTKEDVVMGYEASEGVEGMAAYLVAEKIKDKKLRCDDLNSLRNYLDKMEKYLQENAMKEWAECDASFHDLLTQLSGNKYIIQSRQRISAQINQILWFVTPSIIDKRKSNEEHRKILEAIIEGDAENARIWAQKHRRRVRVSLTKIL